MGASGGGGWFSGSGDLDFPLFAFKLLELPVGELGPGLRLVVVRVLGLYRTPLVGGWFSGSGDLDFPLFAFKLLELPVGELGPGLRLVVVRVLGLYRIVDLVPALRTMVKMGKKD